MRELLPQRYYVLAQSEITSVDYYYFLLLIPFNMREHLLQRFKELVTALDSFQLGALGCYLCQTSNRDIVTSSNKQALQLRAVSHDLRESNVADVGTF